MKNHDVYLNQIDELVKERKYREALILAKRYHHIFPRDDFIKFEVAQLAIKFNDSFLLGEQFLNELLSSPYIITERVWLELGTIETMKGNFDGAIAIYEKIINSNCKIEVFVLLAKMKLAKLKLNLGKYDEVELILSDVLKNEEFDTVTARKMFLYLKIRQGEYKKAYKIFKHLVSDNLLKNECALDIAFFLENKLNHKFERKGGLYNTSYMSRQIANYDFELMKEHIKKHFDEQIDYDKLTSLNFDEMIPSSCNSLCDKYFIKIDEALIDEKGNSTNILGIMTLANTSKIITCFPTDSNKHVYLSQEVTLKPKIYTKQNKRLSQIEKFNLKYGEFEK